jgi:C_GCAxxG_C_C family probable redox protein
MVDYEALRKKVAELGERKWDEKAISARISELVAEGIPRKRLEPKDLAAHKEEILDRVQRRAEEYNFVIKNCAQGTALALMEEFGVGNMEIIKALSPFPGIGGTGKICGGVTGALINFGLCFGSDNPLALKKTENNPIAIAQKYLTDFEDSIGSVYCADIIENVVIGYCINPGDSDEAMAIFAGEKGFEKCGLPPGIGARHAAEIIIDAIQG